MRMKILRIYSENTTQPARILNLNCGVHPTTRGAWPPCSPSPAECTIICRVYARPRSWRSLCSTQSAAAVLSIQQKSPRGVAEHPGWRDTNPTNTENCAGPRPCWHPWPSAFSCCPVRHPRDLTQRTKHIHALWYYNVIRGKNAWKNCWHLSLWCNVNVYEALGTICTHFILTQHVFKLTSIFKYIILKQLISLYLTTVMVLLILKVLTFTFAFTLDPNVWTRHGELVCFGLMLVQALRQVTLFEAITDWN